MTEQQKYWRDKVNQLLGWGSAALIVLAGWSLEHSDLFEIGSRADNLTLGSQFRAYGLIAFSVVFGVSWVFSFNWIYKHHLSEGIDTTVLPHGVVRVYSITVSLLLIIMALLLSIR